MRRAYNTKEAKAQNIRVWDTLRKAVLFNACVAADATGTSSPAQDKDDAFSRKDVVDAGCGHDDHDGDRQNSGDGDGGGGGDDDADGPMEADAISDVDESAGEDEEELGYEIVQTPGESVPRSPLVYFRGKAGTGKTYLVREAIRRKNRLGCDDHELADFARDAVVFNLSFNSLCAISLTDNLLVETKEGAYLPFLLRAVYIEYADYSKMTWLAFSSSALTALTAETLATPIVFSEVEAMLRCRRGAAGAPLILIVDELALCHALPAGRYGAGATYAEDAYRSEGCKLLDACGGVMATTTLSKAFINEETRNSPREVFSGASLRALPNTVSRSILSLALTQMHDNGLTFDSLGQVVVAGLGFERQSPEWNLLVRVLIGVTGGHPRLVCNLARNMSLCTVKNAGGTTLKQLLTTAGSSLLQPKRKSPSLGRSKDFTEAVLLDVLLGKTRTFFEVMECRRLTPRGNVMTVKVRRQDGAPGYYDYDDMTIDTAIGIIESPDDENSGTVDMPPAALFALMQPSTDGRPTRPTLQALVRDILKSHAALRSTSFETYNIAFDRALSLARCLCPDDYKSVIFKDLYKSPSQPCFIGGSALLQAAKVDASIFREQTVYGVNLRQVLMRASDPAHRQEVLRSLYLLQDGTWGIDALSFYECVEDCDQHKKGDLFAEARQFKYSLNASKTKLQIGTIDHAWTTTKQTFGSLWAEWRDRIVFVVIARRKGSIAPETPDTVSPTTTSAQSEDTVKTSMQAADADVGVVEVARREWPDQAIVFGQDDLNDLYGPAFGGVLAASDLWLKVSPFQSFSSVFIGPGTKRKTTARKGRKRRRSCT